MGQDHSREPTEPNITQMIGCLRLLQHRARTEPRFKELLSIPTESTIEYDPQYVFHGTNEEFRFLIRCLEKLNDNVRSEEKMKAELEKLATIQNGSTDDLKLLNQQITMIVEYNEKHIAEINQKHEKVVSGLRKEVDIKARWIKELEKKYGVTDDHPKKTLAPSTAAETQAELNKNLQKKQEKLRKLEEFIVETNRKTLQTAIEFFKEDTGDLVDLHQRIQNLNGKLAEKEREIRNLKEFNQNFEEKRQKICENAYDRLLEKGIPEEMAVYSMNMANSPSGILDEQELVQKAMEWINKNRKKEEMPVLVLKSKKNEEETSPPSTPQAPTLGTFDYTDFKSTEYLISEGISRENLQKACRDVKNDFLDKELEVDAFQELERIFLTCLVDYIDDLPIEKERELIEKAWDYAGLDRDDNESQDSDDIRRQFLEDDMKTRYNSEDESYEPEGPKPEEPVTTSSSSPSSDWSHLEESESSEDDYY